MNSLRAYRERRLDLPTAESPIITTLKRYSSPLPSSSELDVVNNLDKLRFKCYSVEFGGAVGALIVYDISRRTTFDSVGRWLDELKTHCDTTVAMMLVGNKCDLDNIRDVSIEEGKSLAESEGLFFMETSALDSTNVKTAFEMVIREIYNNVSRKVLNSDTYKAELSVNRVSLVNNGNSTSKQSKGYFSCCS